MLRNFYLILLGLIFVVVNIVVLFVIFGVQIKQGRSIDKLSTSISNIDIRPKVEVINKEDKRIPEINQKIVVLEQRVTATSQEFESFCKKMEEMEARLTGGLKLSKEEFSKKNSEIETSIQKLKSQLDSALVDLFSIRKMSNSNNQRIDSIILDLDSVRKCLKQQEIKIDEYKLMFTNYDAVLKLQKSGITCIGKELK